MVSLPLPWFLLSIDFNRYVRTGLGTEGTSDATFRLFHANNVVPVLVILGRICQHILRTEGDAQSTALAPLSINYDGSLWHVWTLSESTAKIGRCSRVPLDGESATGCVVGCSGALSMFSVLPLQMSPIPMPARVGCRSRVTLGISV
jgi:hypothetical protein